jgi:hypothetical protein
MGDRVLALPPPPPPGRLIVIDTRDLVGWLREDLAHLADTSYNLTEIGAVLVEALDIALMGSPEKVAQMRTGFSDHFARMFSRDENEYLFAVEKLDDFFGAVAARVHAIDLEKLGSNGHVGITFHQWLGDDLVLHHHPLPY